MQRNFSFAVYARKSKDTATLAEKPAFSRVVYSLEDADLDIPAIKRAVDILWRGLNPVLRLEIE